MSKTKLYLKRGGIGLLVLVLLLGGAGAADLKSYLPNTVAPRSFPQIDGEIQLDGLGEFVDIYRDEMGIPHIYAASQHDLFFAQGYIHAQDRFWQMDFWRHIGSGSLSEMFGKGQLETDMFLRTLGWRQTAEAEYEELDPTSKAIVNSYVAGVNAYLKDHDKTALSLRICHSRFAQPRLQDRSVDADQQPDLGQSHGMGLARQHGRRDRTRRVIKNTHARAVGRSLPPVPRRPSHHRQQYRGWDFSQSADSSLNIRYPQ